jgi:hypothetical protein
MVALVCFILAALASPFKSKSRLEAENAALRLSRRDPVNVTTNPTAEWVAR